MSPRSLKAVQPAVADHGQEPIPARATRSHAKAYGQTAQAPREKENTGTKKSTLTAAPTARGPKRKPAATASQQNKGVVGKVAQPPTNKKQDRNQPANPRTREAIVDTTNREKPTIARAVKSGGSNRQKSATARRMEIDEPVPRGATNLKRKPSTRKTTSAPDDMELDVDEGTTSSDDVPQPKKARRSKAPDASQKVAVVAAEKAVLQKQLDEVQAQLAARDAEVLRLQNLNTQVQQESGPRSQLIPRPPGERGKNGWNLQRHMGLEDDYDTYSNIRRCVRYAVYESQLDIWARITRQEDMSLFTCYALVKKRFPLMGRFERNWATREFIKGIFQNARKHCKRKGITDPTLPRELLGCDNPDGDKNNDGDGDDDNNDNDKDDNDGTDGDDGDEVDEEGHNKLKGIASGTSRKSVKGKALATATKLNYHAAGAVPQAEDEDESDIDQDAGDQDDEDEEEEFYGSGNDGDEEEEEFKGFGNDNDNDIDEEDHDEE